MNEISYKWIKYDPFDKDTWPEKYKLVLNYHRHTGITLNGMKASGKWSRDREIEFWSYIQYPELTDERIEQDFDYSFINSLKLSPHTRNVLRFLHVTHLDILLIHSRKNLLKRPNLGIKGIKEIEKGLLEMYGAKLKDE